MNYKRITKKLAHKLYYEGFNIIIIGSKVKPENFSNLGKSICFTERGAAGFFQNVTNFEIDLKPEHGKRASFYLQE